MHLDLENFTGRACNAGSAFEFVPRQGASHSLDELAERLSQAGLTLEIRSPLVLVFIFDEREISWYKSNKLLVKGETDAARAHSIAQRLFRAIQDPASAKKH